MSNHSAANYVVGFFDLLGQQDALKGQCLIPKFSSPDEDRAFRQKLMESVGSIYLLQKRAEDLIGGALRVRRNSPLRAQLTNKQRRTWDQMHRSNLRTQRWSDGLMNFVALGDPTVLCPMTAIFAQIGMAGALCFMGLSSKQPIRGALEVAWGVELNPGELHGAAVARAYELESKVAQWPRIVLGPQLVRYLSLQAANPAKDAFAQNNRALAQFCAGMIATDVDGQHIVDYLGDTFRDGVMRAVHDGMYDGALKYINAQIECHRGTSNVKLQTRYETLLQYFDARMPASVSQPAA